MNSLHVAVLVVSTSRAVGTDMAVHGNKHWQSKVRTPNKNLIKELHSLAY